MINTIFMDIATVCREGGGVCGGRGVTLMFVVLCANGLPASLCCRWLSVPSITGAMTMS